jgi:hypothetical protein
MKRKKMIIKKKGQQGQVKTLTLEPKLMTSTEIDDMYPKTIKPKYESTGWVKVSDTGYEFPKYIPLRVSHISSAKHRVIIHYEDEKIGVR